MTKAQHEKAYNKVVRNLQRAAEILSTEAKIEDNHYQYIRYVKKACGIAYDGVLLAVNTYLALRGKPMSKKNEELSLADYRTELGQRNKKLLTAFIDAYHILHLSGSYDGLTIYHIIKVGMQAANIIANHIRPAGLAAIKIKI